MDFDLNKLEGEEEIYYFSDNGNVVGPFTMARLIEKIGPETLVYREGINWTNANEVEELKKFFKAEKVVVKPTPSILVQEFVTNPKKTGSPVAEQKKMFSSPFSSKGRIRRMEYGISLFISGFANTLVLAMVDALPIVSLALIPIIWFFLAQGAKRCHDRGNSGWFQLIPYYVFWMVFADSEPGSNQYGSSPKN